MINKDRWLEIQTIIDKIFEYSAENKSLYLQQLCGDDRELYREVQTLLQAEANSPAYLEHWAADLAGQMTSSIEQQPDCDFTGTRIGPYQLCQEVGRGGMGVVYQAQRVSGEFDQQVAIKLLKLEGNFPLREARFQQEQQLLASLSHSNIAQLFDGGFTASGQPYIVMEFVQGTEINHYCNLHRLTVHQRLKLLLQVADALGYAHQRLIVHRDIKPSNILVTESGQVKLLDFGIAKLIEHDKEICPQHQSSSLNTTELTHTGEQIMTPGFAAPEQLSGQNITIATDVYQLGLVLYELLCGHQAYRDQAGNFYELAKVICTKAPTLPSAMVEQCPLQGGLENDHRHKEHRHKEHHRQVLTPTLIGKQRRLSRRQLNQTLKGDLDAIVLKALRHDPAERYASVSEFSADIHAYFEARPVGACQPTMKYVLFKFLHRYYWQSLSAAVVVVILLAYATTVTIQAKRIQQALLQTRTEAMKANRVSEFLIDIFKASDPFQKGAEQINARQLLDRGQKKVFHELEQYPSIQGHMLTALGEINQSLGETQISIQLLEQALTKNRRALAPDHLTIARNLQALARAYNDNDEYEKAVKLLQESLKLYQQYKQHDEFEHLDKIAETHNLLGGAFYRQGKITQAQTQWRYIEQLLRAKTDGFHGELAVALNNLAIIYHINGQFDKAVNAIKESIAIREKIQGENHPRIGLNLHNFAVQMMDWEYLAESKALYNRALIIQKKHLGAEHPFTLKTQKGLAVVLHKEGQFEAALTLFKKTLVSQENVRGSDSVDVANTLYRLGDLLQDAGRYSEAESIYQRMIAIYRKHAVSQSLLGRALAKQASLKRVQGNLTAAQLQYQQALALLPAESMRTSIAQLGFSLVLLDSQLVTKAKTLIEKVLKQRSAKLPEGHSLIAEAQAALGAALLRLAQQNESNQSSYLKRKAIALLIPAYSNLYAHRMENEAFHQLARNSLMTALNIRDSVQLQTRISSMAMKKR